MINEIFFISAFVYGISSSFHCITMCGPFVGMLNIIGESKLVTNLVYNLGRFASYTLIGFFLGLMGFGINLTDQVIKIHNISIIISFVFILISGLALIFKRKLLSDTGVNKFIKNLFFPLIEKMRKSTHTILFSFAFGALTGLLPCVVLYPAFAMALATGSPLLGGISMASFFLGTLPGLLLFGLGFHKIKSFVKKDHATLVGLGIIIIGLSTVYFRMNHDHSNHGDQNSPNKIEHHH